MQDRPIKRLGKRNVFQKLILLITLLMFIIQIVMAGAAFAAEPERQKAPEKLTVNEVGNNLYDGNYIDFKWEYPSGFFVPEAIRTYVNFYKQEIPKPYKSMSSARMPAEEDIRVDHAYTVHRIRNLKPGTVYYFDMTAHYEYMEGDKMLEASESAPSNRVKVMTSINLAAYAAGPNRIRIEWDDVWNSDGRIGYRLYIADNAMFNNTAPKYIGADDIGEGKPVQLNESQGKLVYFQTVSQPGKVYYIKVVPEVIDSELAYYPSESNVAMVSSFIIARTTKMSSSAGGSIWKLDWSPVITELGSGVDIKYEIYKGYIDSPELPNRIQSVKNTSIYVVISPDEEASVYFIIRAVITKDGVPVYPGIKIESDKVMLVDQEVSAYPPVPQMTDNLGDVEEEFLPDRAVLLWKLPRTATGEVDYNTWYDVWITADYNLIDDDEKLGVPISWDMKNGDYTGGNGIYTLSFSTVRSGSNVLGCRVEISGLDANSTYYFKIRARKEYFEYDEQEQLVSVPYSSDPVVRIIITPAEGGINKPSAPLKPPFKLKNDPEGISMVTDTTAVLQIKKRWFEKYDEETNMWSYVRTEKLSAADTTYEFDPSVINIEDWPVEGYRLVEYDDDITIDVYYVKYQEGVIYDDLDNEEKYNPSVIRGFKLETNDPYENPVLNLDLSNIPEEQRKKRNVDLLISGLEPNTVYVMWVKAVRQSAGLSSEPSDPIVVTTRPTDALPAETPTVPTLIVSNVGDTYIDLVWDFKAGYTYYIKYGTSDNLDSATGNATVNLQELSYFRVSGLVKDTLYYFWIQAECVNPNGESARSAWSDSCYAKTLPHIPPETPLGFGVKTSEDAVTKNSITYEWLKEEDMEYILEIATDIDYSDAKEYAAGAVSELMVEGLRSNCRYFARLYAFDPSTGLRSDPTRSIAVKTLRSIDDYDSDVDIDAVIPGDIVVKETKAVKGIWSIEITGINADRFIERIQRDGILDYLLDATKPPSKTEIVRICISVRVFEALSVLGENLVIAMEDCRLVIRPNVITRRLAGKKGGDFNYELLIKRLDNSDAIAGIPRTMNLKTDITGIELSYFEGSNRIKVNAFDAPLRVLIPYTDKTWYKEGVTYGVVKDTYTGTWKQVKTSSVFNSVRGEGFVAFELTNPFDIAVADKINRFYYDDIYGHKYERSINNLAFLHELKSITGSSFRPDELITVGDAVKLMLDVLDYSYTNVDYMPLAVKAGFIRQDDMGRSSSHCSREKAIMMVVRVYEIKSRERAVASGSYKGVFRDMNDVSAFALPKVGFAVENGLVVREGQNTLAPRGTVTRGEVAAMLERVLALVGELD